MRHKECTVRNGQNKKCSTKATKIVSYSNRKTHDYMCEKHYQGYRESTLVGSNNGTLPTIKDITP